jgi:hypothetical protein
VKHNDCNGIFSAKMGMALTFVSFLMFMNVSGYQDIDTNCVWAILTMVVVFEFTISETLRRVSIEVREHFQRVLYLLLSQPWLPCWETRFCSIATFAKLYPTLRSYEYCFTVVTLTFCFILVSVSRTRQDSHIEVIRFLLNVVGITISLVVNACIYPSGQKGISIN